MSTTSARINGILVTFDGAGDQAEVCIDYDPETHTASWEGSWEAVAHAMDDDLRERAHSDLDVPCTEAAFLTYYAEMLDPGFLQDLLGREP